VSTLCICVVFVPMFFLTGVCTLFVSRPLGGGPWCVRDAGIVYPVAPPWYPRWVMLMMEAMGTSSPHASMSPLQARYTVLFNARLLKCFRGRLLDHPRGQRSSGAACFAGTLSGILRRLVRGLSGVHSGPADFFPSVDGRPDSPCTCACPTGTGAIEETARVAERGGRRPSHPGLPAASSATVLDNLGVGGQAAINKDL